MRNIHFDNYWGAQLPREVQLRRMKQVIREVLSPAQREILMAYYFQRKRIPQIARERGVHKSTVWRTLNRAEENLQRHLKF